MAFDYAAKVRALLANAENEALEPSTRQAFRDKAYEMMKQYQVAESQALAEDPTSAEPEVLHLEVKATVYHLAHHLVQIAQACAQHAEVRLLTKWSGMTLRGTAVGYPGDLRYFEFLWTNAHLMFATKITPVWDMNRTDEENVFLMRQAGIKRREIAEAAGWDGDNAAVRSKIQRMYVKAAKTKDVEAVASGLGFDSRNYREAYAESFVTTLRIEMRRSREADHTMVPAIFNRAEKVQEAFYMHCPEARPGQDVDTPYVAPNANCDRCKRAASGFCREHAWLKPKTWTQADEERYQRRMNSSSRQAGRESGRSAARGVVVSRGMSDHPAPRHVEASNREIEG